MTSLLICGPKVDQLLINLLNFIAIQHVDQLLINFRPVWLIFIEVHYILLDYIVIVCISVYFIVFCCIQLYFIVDHWISMYFIIFMCSALYLLPLGVSWIGPPGGPRAPYGVSLSWFLFIHLVIVLLLLSSFYLSFHGLLLLSRLAFVARVKGAGGTLQYKSIPFPERGPAIQIHPISTSTHPWIKPE